MDMPFFASPLGIFLCVALGLTLTTINVIDVINIKKNRYKDLKAQRAIRTAYRTGEITTVVIIAIFLTSLIH